MHAGAAAGEPSLATLDATRSRPLFAPSRRPPPPPPEIVGVTPPPAPPAPPPRLQLSGVIVGSGKRLAIVTNLDQSKTFSVEIGNQIEGWTVARVNPRGITLKRDDRVVTVELPVPGH